MENVYSIRLPRVVTGAVTRNAIRTAKRVASTCPGDNCHVMSPCSQVTKVCEAVRFHLCTALMRVYDSVKICAASHVAHALHMPS